MDNPVKIEGNSYLKESEIESLCTAIEGVTIVDCIMASDLIDGYLGKSYAPIVHTEKVALRRRRGKLRFSPVLKVVSVESITSTVFGQSRQPLKVEDIELDPELDGYFTFIGSYGMVGMVFESTPDMLWISYTSGFENYPSRLKTATAMLSSNIRQAQSFAGAKQLTSLDFQVLMTDDSFFTSDIKMLLKGLSA